MSVPEHLPTDFLYNGGIPPLLTIEEAAALLKIGRTNTYGLVMGGEIQSVKIGRRRLVVTASIVAFIDRLLDQQI